MGSIATSWAAKKRKRLSDDMGDFAPAASVSPDRNIAVATDSLISRSLKRLRVDSVASINKLSSSVRGQNVPARPAASPRKSGKVPAPASKTRSGTAATRATCAAATHASARYGRRMSMPGQTPRRTPRKPAKLVSKRQQDFMHGVQTLTRPHPVIRKQGGGETSRFRVASLDAYTQKAPPLPAQPFFNNDRFPGGSTKPEQMQEVLAEPLPPCTLPRWAAPTASSRAKTVHTEKALPPLPLNVQRQRPLTARSINNKK
jgi:hypothetical protein